MSHVLVIFRVPGSLNHAELETLRAGLEALAFRNGIELETSQPITELTPPRALLQVFAGLRARYAIRRAQRRTQPTNTPPTAA